MSSLVESGDSSYDIDNVETVPDEDFEKGFKQRDKVDSWPNDRTVVTQVGPNINWQFQKKRYNTEQEKTFFFEKIKKKKKTELCKNYELYKDCYYKNECSVAHGLEELRQFTSQPGYKTKICKSFNDNMICNFGIRCNYLHIIKTSRIYKYSYILNNEAQELFTEMLKQNQMSNDIIMIYKKLINSKKVQW